MPTIHLPGDGHLTWLPLGDGTAWDSYVDKDALATLKAAIDLIRRQVKGLVPCNKCFSKLPGGRNFDEVFEDASIYVSFDGGGPNSGVTNRAGGKEVTISARELRTGKWSVAATLIHELAHCNGASGTSIDAENTLNCCGFKKHFRPGAIGALSGGRSRVG
jgi:hypothetical protein